MERACSHLPSDVHSCSFCCSVQSFSSPFSHIPYSFLMSLLRYHFFYSPFLFRWIWMPLRVPIVPWIYPYHSTNYSALIGSLKQLYEGIIYVPQNSPLLRVLFNKVLYIYRVVEQSPQSNFRTFLSPLFLVQATWGRCHVLLSFTGNSASGVPVTK